MWDTEIPCRLPFWREFCWILRVRVASGVDTKFAHRVRIVDRGGLILATLFAATVSDSQTLEQFIVIFRTDFWHNESILDCQLVSFSFQGLLLG